MPNGESTLTAALNKLAALGTERDREQLLALLDRLDAPVLAGGVELVDTRHRVRVPVGHPGSP